jgi:hypothetical protein
MSHDSFDLEAFRTDPNRMRSATPGVYFLFLDEKLQYIGESEDCKRREERHRQRIPRNDWAMIPVDGDRPDRKAVEDELISKFRPPWNWTHR